MTKKVKKCVKCFLLNKVFLKIKKPSNRDYWLFTEFFVSLHGGLDYCKRCYKK